MTSKKVVYNSGLTGNARRLAAVVLLAWFCFAVTANAQTTPHLTGINLAGAEFGEANLPGVFGTDYTYPDRAEITYFAAQGMNVFRLPFRWERLQTMQFGALDVAELARIKGFIANVNAVGGQVILNPHNYARYYGQVIGVDAGKLPVAAFVDFWSRLAGEFKDDDRIIFGLMNEPNGLATELWLTIANAAIHAIRDTGAQNLVLVPGNGWTGAHSWSADYYGTPNGVVMLGITDPADNFAYEVHQYLDANSSGKSATCVSETIGAQGLGGFTDWLRQNNAQGFLAEFAGGRNRKCLKALDNMLSHLNANTDVWLGWSYWAAGPWWGDYMFTLAPEGAVARPQMAVLRKHLAR